MNFKEMKVEVDRLLSAGHSKYDVFNRMSGKGVTDEKLAFIIALYADPRRVAVNRIWIKILLTVIVIQAVSSFFVGLGQGINSHSDVAWLWGVGGAFLPLACCFNIYKNQVVGYNIYFVTLMLCLKGAMDIAKTSPISALIAVGFILGIGGYTWFVKQRVFPDFVFTKVKKVNGFYTFTDWQTNKEPFSEENTSKIPSSENSRIRKSSIWVILSLIIYILSLAFILTSFSPQLDRHWVFDLEIAVHCAAIICILFYIFNYRPSSLLILFKMFLVLLIAVDVVWWSRYSHFLDGNIFDAGHIVVFLTLAIIFCLTTAPAWYICFRFAYPNNIK
ncbi:MAG: hypothetical protein KGO49_03020 [Gammaproteobacteria bacterium]|nr:hypothetical protein [Gammaproteobacteria bacterium]